VEILTKGSTKRENSMEKAFMYGRRVPVSKATSAKGSSKAKASGDLRQVSYSLVRI
jgi:hypothetical protein